MDTPQLVRREGASKEGMQCKNNKPNGVFVLSRFLNLIRQKPASHHPSRRLREARRGSWLWNRRMDADEMPDEIPIREGSEIAALRFVYWRRVARLLVGSSFGLGNLIRSRLACSLNLDSKYLIILSIVLSNHMQPTACRMERCRFPVEHDAYQDLNTYIGSSWLCVHISVILVPRTRTRTGMRAPMHQI